MVLLGEITLSPPALSNLGVAALSPPLLAKRVLSGDESCEKPQFSEEVADLGGKLRESPLLSSDKGGFGVRRRLSLLKDRLT